MQSTIVENVTYKFSQICNSAIDPMWLIRIEDGEYFFYENINASFIKATGCQNDKVVGRLINEVLPPKLFQLVREKYREVIRTGKMLDYIEVADYPAGKRVAEVRAIPVFNDEGIVTKIVGIAHDITEKQDLREKLSKELNSFNKRLTAATIKSQERERNAIGWELHDNVNQVLTTVKLYTELCASGAVDLDIYLPKCTSILNDAINEIRRLSKQLATPSLGSVGIAESMSELVESVQLTKKVNVSLHIPSRCCNTIDEDLQLAVYRITQEHLTNILKHAKATHVSISLACSPTRLSLVISDDGVGFDTNQKAAGVGITNMMNRANLYSGELSIQSATEKGCTLTVHFPVECEGVF